VKVISDEAFRLDASPAVQTIIAALRHLAHPEDMITTACLKKECTELGLTALHEKLSPQLLQLPLYEMTEQIYTMLHPDEQGDESAYLCAFFDKVNAFVQDYGSDIDTFLKEWDENIASTAIQSAQTSGLRLISIHKSKGLEFPHVLIPFCDWKLELPDVLWCSPQEEPFSQLPLAPIDFSQKSMKGTIYEKDYDEEHQQNVVDNLNLLYVAFTRASQCLHVWGKRKASATSRSALLAQVLPAVAERLTGATLSGNADDDSCEMTFEYGDNTPQATTEKKERKATANPFLQPSQPMKVGIGVMPAKVDFRQSNKSQEFASSPDDDAADADNRRQEYIQLGSVMHGVLSAIRTADDVDQALWQMEQDGVLYGEGNLSRSQLTAMLRKRIASPQVEEWFRPGRWQLFNECTILSIDRSTGRVVERRPDRVMTDGEQTIVVDFKFGNDRKEYHEQVRQYMDLLRQMGHGSVKGYLWLVYSNKIIEV
jgi:ATP-dependent exoDNAse (exonuclease V) beta subunit